MNMTKDHRRVLPALGDATAQENTVLTGAAINQGDTGDTVGLLQQQLKSWGFDPGGADGIYGPNTASAVSALQRKLGLAPNGNFDEQTQEAVLKDLQSSSSVIRQNQTVTKMSPSGAGKGTTKVSATGKGGGQGSLFESPWVIGGTIALIVGGIWWWRRRKYTVPASTRSEPELERLLPSRHVMSRPRRAKRTASRHRRAAR